MKQAEFLNLDTKQIQWLDASLEHPNLVKVPEVAEIATLCNGFVIFWKDDKYSFSIKEGNKWCYKSNDDSIYFDFNEYMRTYNDAEIIWQRNSLQEKINETLSTLNVNKAQLSILLGREKSYVKRLLAKGRNVTENTKAAVIDQLEQLIRVHEYEQAEPKCIGELTVQLSIDTKEVQDELEKAFVLIDQANDNAEMYRQKYEFNKNLVKLMIGLTVLSLLVVFAEVAL